ncbi:MAG: glycerophosphodiester phosphodiesterase family protein [Pseudorhizobium pelagicum]|uniref:glycerophosphodiester phosphodiesterase family protein n=1 Tax=Pseudorhizobium pelagicum TaxID=1509405 RepID=UPI00346098F8
MNYREFIQDGWRDCAVVAHRGIWREAPENSLPAIGQAIEEGCDVVEIDVRRSADGGLFLLHDETLARMAGLDQAPETLPSHWLSALKLRSRDGSGEGGVTGHHLPRLEEVFELARGRIFLHLDVKDRSVIPEVIACARDQRVDQQVNFWGDLRTPQDLDWVRQVIEPHGLLFMAKTRLNQADSELQKWLLAELAPSLCEVYFDDVAQIEALNRSLGRGGPAFWVNTLDSVSCAGLTDTAALADPDAVWGLLIDAGVSVIQTDETATLQSYLATRRIRNARTTR